MEKVQIATLKKALLIDIQYVADELREHIETPAVIILTGDMGAGKTTLVKAFCPELPMNSPSYSIVNEIGDVAHIDLYRIKSTEEITHLELPSYTEGKKYIFVEWGIDYVYSLWKNLGDDFTYYEVSIEINKSISGAESASSRNYILTSLGNI